MKIKKILICNRGEIAVRIIRACQELGIQTIAVYSEADAESLHVKMADEKVCIGPAPANLSYLQMDNIIHVAREYEADAIHPGYGFLAEDAAFAKKCEEENITFIGPNSKHIELMGNKIVARDTVNKAGVPIIEGIERDVNPDDFPLLIKASAGGGGRGMRIVHHPDELEHATLEAKKEADAAFGDETIYIEKYIENAKHIEVQIIADNHGNVIQLGERDCSIQRRHQKLVEESPCVFIPDEIKAKLYKDAIKIAKDINYVNVGTVEFLVDLDREEHYFLEMNTRIQVEHPVTEMITGIDIIKEQIRVSEGKELSVRQKDVQFSGHSIECRINAENPLENFNPSPGKITNYVAPGGFGIRVDSFCYSGYKVQPFYDSMIGKVIVKGKDRQEAIDKLKAALKTFYIEGIKTTIPLHLKIMDNNEFLEGSFNTNWLEDSDLMNAKHYSDEKR